MIIEKAYAKLNLSLDILSKRPDGYHNLLMIMQTVDLADELQVVFDGDSFSYVCNWPELTFDQSNLVARAIRVFSEECNLSFPHLQIRLIKKIPYGAGMGGGSADAAAMLRILRRVYAPQMPITQLLKLGEKIGSDVPYCILGGTYLAEGRGEILTKLASFEGGIFVICKPDFSISTKELYGKVDLSVVKERMEKDYLLQSYSSMLLRQNYLSMCNRFEQYLPSDEKAEIQDIKDLFLNCGAYYSMMTGSGSAVFGLFSSKIEAEIAVEKCSKKYSQVFLAKPIEGYDL